MNRDFTHVDDVIQGAVRVLGHIPASGCSYLTNSYSAASMTPEPRGERGRRVSRLALPLFLPHRLYSIGNHASIGLLRFSEVVEQDAGKRAGKNLLLMQPGDVPATPADVDALIRNVGFQHSTPIEVGAEHFVAWSRDSYSTSALTSTLP